MACVRCGSAVSADGAGLNRKYISRGCSEFLCLKCLAEKLGVTEERLEEKAEEFRRAGCALFVSGDKNG